MFLHAFWPSICLLWRNVYLGLLPIFSMGLFSCYWVVWAVCVSVQFSCSVMSNSLRPHGLQHARLPCPSPTLGVYSNSCPFSQWCHPTISSSLIPFSSCLQSFPASGSFPMSQFFASGGWSTGVSALASVLPMNIQDWFPLGWTGWISLKSKELSRVFSNTTVQKHQSALRDTQHYLWALLLMFLLFSSWVLHCHTPGFSVLHYLPEFAQFHVHWVNDAI